MALTKEQISQAKEQLRQQITHLPPQQQEAAKRQIDEMSDEAIESLVVRSQEQAGNAGNSPGGGNQKGIFRMIVDGDVPSVGVGSNKDCIAVMDINPISKGHVMIVPKKAVNDSKLIPTTCFSLGKSIAKKITSKLGAKKTELHTENKFGESIIHVLPEYDAPVTLESPRSPADKSELEGMAKKINPPKKEVIRIGNKRSSKKKDSAVLKLKRRIP